MPKKLIDLVTIDFSQFKLNKIKPGLFNEMHMTMSQYDVLRSFLSEVKPELGAIKKAHARPDKNTREILDIKTKEVAYRDISVTLKINPRTHLVEDWSYCVSFLASREDGSPGMRFDDTHYSRSQARALAHTQRSKG